MASMSMSNELTAIFEQGDADLHALAGEPAVLVRKVDGERVACSAVISAAEVAYELRRATGPVLTCERVAHIRREGVGRAPLVGDMLEAGGQVYEVVRVTGWALDSSWHVDLAVRKKEGRK